MKNFKQTLHADLRGRPHDIRNQLTTLLDKLSVLENGNALHSDGDAPVMSLASERLRDTKLAEMHGEKLPYKISAFADEYDPKTDGDAAFNALAQLCGHLGLDGIAAAESSDAFHLLACHVKQDLAVVKRDNDGMIYLADISAFEKTPKDRDGGNKFLGRNLLDIHSQAPNLGLILRIVFPEIIKLFRDRILDLLSVDLNGQKEYLADKKRVRRFERDYFMPIRDCRGRFYGVLGVADVFFQDPEETISPYEGGSYVKGIEMQTDLADISENEPPKIIHRDNLPQKDLAGLSEQFKRGAISLPEKLTILKGLLDNENPDALPAAMAVNLRRFGNRLDLYGISYISDRCLNDCSYCGHRSSMRQTRSALTHDEMVQDFSAILRYSPEELCILAGEDPHLIEVLEQAFNALGFIDLPDNLRQISLNIAPQSFANFRRILRFFRKFRKCSKDISLQYRIFQETYDPAVYRRYHPSDNPKGDFARRIQAQARALRTGFHSAGIGVLMGLNDVKYSGLKDSHDFEIISLLQHAHGIKEMTGKFPKTLSIPRHQPVSDLALKTPNPVDDEKYIYYHALLRLFLPETKLIITSRETPEMIQRLEPFINIRDLAPRPGVGGNFRHDVHFQNELGDPRSALEILEDLKARGKYEIKTPHDSSQKTENPSNIMNGFLGC